MANYDQGIIDAILARGQQVSDPSARNRYIRAALQTGIVESGLQNLNHGDADSLGWRQERASLYKNPTNVTASVNRFFDEAAHLDHGQPSWQLAADVQRPAARYRGRYKDVAQQAAALLGGGSARPVSPSTTTSPAGGAEQLVPSAPTSGPTLQSGQGGDYTSVLSSLLGQQQPQQQASTPLAPPAFMAQIAQPHGFHPLEGSGAPQQQASSADPGLLGALRGSGVGVDANAPVSTVDAPAAAAPQTVVQKVQSARKSRGFVGSGVLELIYNGGNDGNGFGIKDGRTVNGSAVFSDVWAGHANHVHVAAGPKTVVELGKLAQKMGLHVGENPHFGGVDPVHVPGSYHYKGEAIDVSGDAKKMALFAQEVADYNKTHKL